MTDPDKGILLRVSHGGIFVLQAGSLLYLRGQEVDIEVKFGEINLDNLRTLLLHKLNYNELHMIYYCLPTMGLCEGRRAIVNDYDVEVYQVDFLVLSVGRFSDILNIPEFPPGKGPEAFQGKVMLEFGL